MARFFCSARLFGAAVVAGAFLMAGCGSKSSSQQSGGVNVDPVALWASISNSIQQTANTALGSWDWGRFLTNFGTLLINRKYDLEMQKVTYQSTGADGKVHSMTGLLILPKASGAAKPSVPILMYQHGTEPFRTYSPSQYLAHSASPTDYPEVMVAAAIASTGYAVAMTDYEGMGDNTSPQPYAHGASLARQVIDMLRASRDIIGGTTGSTTSPCSWNGQLFLMGYSEGGYVTMTATRELQLDPAREFTVTASAPLSGPHDLSGVMRGVILSDATFKAPYFLPFVITGYNYAYGTKTTFFSADYSLKPPYNTAIFPLFDGNTPADKISEAMGMSFSPAHLIVPKVILTQEFINQLVLDTSPVVAFLRENDSYRGWAPAVPMRMYHHKSDDLVPYGNSQAAFDAFSTAGAKKWVSLIEETVTIPISSDPVKTVHVSAAFPELSDGWKWIDGFKK